MRRFTKKRAVAALSLIAVLALAGGAYAYFTSTGNGTGTATVGSASTWTVGETGTATGGPLYPDAAIGGANVQTDKYTVTNAGKGSQNLTQVVVSIANANGSAWSSQTNPATPACTAADFSVGAQAVGTAWTDTSLAGDYTASQSKNGTVTVEMIDSGKNQNNCQGLTVPLYFSAS
jgi:allophanate hydrolase subunit 2